MINKVSHSVHCVRPGTVGVLILQHEIQVPLCYWPIVIPGQDLGSARQQKRPVGGGIDDSAAVVRREGTTTGSFRCPEILDIVRGMTRNRLEDLLVLVSPLGS